jgi:hypothetical protein
VVVARGRPFRKIWYPVTPVASVEAVHVRAIEVLLRAVPEKLPGAVGGIVSLGVPGFRTP